MGKSLSQEKLSLPRSPSTYNHTIFIYLSQKINFEPNFITYTKILDSFNIVFNRYMKYYFSICWHYLFSLIVNVSLNWVGKLSLYFCETFNILKNLS